VSRQAELTRLFDAPPGAGERPPIAGGATTGRASRRGHGTARPPTVSRAQPP